MKYIVLLLFLVGCSFNKTPKQNELQMTQEQFGWDVGDCFFGTAKQKDSDGKNTTASWKITGKGKHVYKYCMFINNKDCGDKILVMKINTLHETDAELTDCLDEI